MKYYFVIGSMDDFSSQDELKDAVANYEEGNYSVFSVFAEHEYDALMIGRGMAFSNDWCLDGTISYLEMAK